MRATQLLTALITATLATVALGQASAADLAKGLKSRDSADRLRAANELSKLGAGASGAMRQLVAALKDEVPEVRNAAADALGKVGKPAVRTIGDAIAERDTHIGGLRAASHLGPLAVELLPGITRCWLHITEGSSKATSDCLRKIGEPALPHLIKCLEDHAINAEACSVLQSMGPKAKPAVPALIALAGNKRVLGATGAAVAALGHIGDPEAVTALLAAAEVGMDKLGANEAVTSKALRALGQLRADADRVVPLLLRVLASERRDEGWIRIQWEALNALRSFDVRTPAVLAALRAFLAAEPGENKRDAEALLKKLGG